MPILAAIARGAAAAFGNAVRIISSRAVVFAESLMAESLSAIENKIIQSVPNSLSSFISQGGNFIRRIMFQSGSETVLSRNIRLNVSSYSTINPDMLNNKIQKYFNQRIDFLRANYPGVDIGSIVSSSASTSVANSSNPEAGFIDFANSMKIMEKSIDDIVRIESQASASVMKRQLMMYPPQPLNTQYIRTFELRHGWDIGAISFNASDIFAGDVMQTASNMSTTISFSNAVPYSKWVQRRATQSRVHRGRWNTVEDVAEQESPNLSDRIENAMSTIFGDM